MEIFGRHFEILRPAWLAGLVLLPLVAVYCRWSLAGLSRGRRALSLSARLLLLAALLLALCDLKVTWPSGRQMVVFALDQSASIAESSRREAETFMEQAASQAHGNRVAYLPFAASAGRVQAELPQGQGKGDSPHLPGRPEGCFAQMGTVPFFPPTGRGPTWRRPSPRRRRRFRPITSPASSC